MELKDSHINYLRNKGKFTIDCNHAIFTISEIELLEKYGNWFMGLTKGDLIPFNNSQEHFIKVAKKETKPETDYEKLWFKYLKRKEIEQQYGNSLYDKPVLEEDTFLNRDMAKNLRSTMFKVMKDAHKK